MDRNAILSNIISNYSTYSTDTSGVATEKVLKYSGDSFDIRERGDIKTEVVMFRLLGGNSDYLVADDKPEELVQDLQALVYVQQSDSISTKEARYDRMLAITDDIVNWSLQVSGGDISSDVYHVTFTGVSPVDEEDGYLATDVNIQITIQT